MTLSLSIRELDVHQVWLALVLVPVKESTDAPLQPRQVTAQLPRAARVGRVMQDDKEPVGSVKPSLGRLVLVQPASQFLRVGVSVGQIVVKTSGQPREFEVEPLPVQVKIYAVVEWVRLGSGAGVGQDDVERGLVGVKVVPATDDIAPNSRSGRPDSAATRFVSRRSASSVRME